MSKQTAVEWLQEQFDNSDDDFITIEEFNQAKEMEKEQIEYAYCDGVDDEYEHHINNEPRRNSEQYYNEKFNK
jgi:hypothetical protein